MKAGADPNNSGLGEISPLHSALWNFSLAPERKLATAELLLAAGADVDKKVGSGETVLSLTAITSIALPPEAEKRMVEMLLAAGADVNQRNLPHGN
jgi:ankyrin repeat protein